MILVGILAGTLAATGWTRAAGWLMLAGIVIFSGSLYLLALTGQRWLGMITPIGGVAFILAWAALIVAVRPSSCRRQVRDRSAWARDGTGCGDAGPSVQPLMMARTALISFNFA